MGQNRSELTSYTSFVVTIRDKIRAAQIEASLNVNIALIQMYWEIGQYIIAQQEEHGWGAKIIDNLACDLKMHFPNLKGFSARNLKYMRRFALTYPDLLFVQSHLHKLPWWHNIVLMDKLPSNEERAWYARQSLENQWSRNTLAMWIESRLIDRKGSSLNNFADVIMKPDSDLVQQITKDPYCFDFLNISEQAKERDIEDSLCQQMQRFLLELGRGFAFVGKQYKLTVGEKEFFIDLLFYHYILRRFIVVELKAEEFKPEHAGKMAFYLSAVDNTLRNVNTDECSIGIIICKTKDKVVVEYALHHTRHPIGVSSFSLPPLTAELLSNLPSEDEIARGVDGIEE